MSNEAVNYIFIKFTKSGYSALRFYDNNEEKKITQWMYFVHILTQIPVGLFRGPFWGRSRGRGELEIWNLVS